MITENRFNQRGVNLNYATSPRNGSPLLMLHGVTRRWQTFLPIMSDLVVDWQLFAPDFRGHGKSSTSEAGYLVTDYVLDVTTFIKQFDHPVVIYGHSLGAMVAATLAATSPEHVRAVILEDPPLHTMGNRIAESNLLDLFNGFLQFAGDRRQLDQIVHDLSQQKLRNPLTGKEVTLGYVRDEASLRFTASCLQELDPAVLTPILEGQWLRGYETESIFRRIQCPVLLIQADFAAGGMLNDDDATQIESWTKAVTRIQISNVGHLIHWSATDKLINSIMGFLKSVPQN